MTLADSWQDKNRLFDIRLYTVSQYKNRDVAVCKASC